MKLTLFPFALLTVALAHTATQAGELPARQLTTRQQTVRPVVIPDGTKPIYPSNVVNYAVYGYSAWQTGPGVDDGQRFELMQVGYKGATNAARLLNFFTLTDIHITDKESPVQGIYSGYLGKNSSAYSPVMLYSTHVLDAAVRAINGLHRQTPFDFGMALGDAANGAQYNELRWYIDVLDGQPITPSSGNNAGADTIDYQKQYQAEGLDKSIPWYQTLGNHDCNWLGSYPITDYFRPFYTNDTILLLGDLFVDGPDTRVAYMGSIDGRTPFGDIIGVGAATNFATAPKVLASDPNRRPLSRSQWMSEFMTTSSMPNGHGFTQASVTNDFASYSFEPKTNMPVKVIVLDDTQTDDNYDLHGQGFLNQQRFDWLVGELDKGQAEDKLMIVSAHIPIELIGYGFATPPAFTSTNLLAKLHTYPNLILWVSGHVHRNKITPHPSPYPTRPEYGFWEVETASLRDFPQQFRTFDIRRNTDNTISILATDVDTDVTNAPLAAISRGYAIGASRIFQNPSASFTDTNSYATNAELVKLLSPPMQTKIVSYGKPLSRLLSVDRIGSEVSIAFIGKLQSADTILGPWAQIEGATNPWKVVSTNVAKFFRATEQ
jgi:metallophosphoesterase (TIGR03768 family)